MNQAVMFDGEAFAAAVRVHFPILEQTIGTQPLVYLDNAATSLTPDVVTAAMRRYLDEVSANIHRGKHMLSEDASTEYEACRSDVARFVGAQANEVSFVSNTTEGLNTVASGLDLSPTDVVVAVGDAHHSNLLPWRRVADVRTVRVLSDGLPDMNHYDELLRLSPRVVALTHCSNVTGVVAPIAEMTARAKERDALVVLDAAQTAPHSSIDVRALGVDALAFSGHKMLGPTGIGVLYLRHELGRRLRPLSVGGGTVDWVDRDGFVLREPPHRFEAGTPNVAGVYGLRAAIAFLSQLGMDDVRHHSLLLGDSLVAAAASRDYIRVLAPDSRERAAILSVEIDGVRDLGNVARMLSDSYGIMCRSGHLCAQPLVDDVADGQVLRISGYVYNTTADVEGVFEALDEIREWL